MDFRGHGSSIFGGTDRILLRRLRLAVSSSIKENVPLKSSFSERVFGPIFAFSRHVVQVPFLRGLISLTVAFSLDAPRTFLSFSVAPTIPERWRIGRPNFIEKMLGAAGLRVLPS